MWLALALLGAGWTLAGMTYAAVEAMQRRRAKTASAGNPPHPTPETGTIMRPDPDPRYPDPTRPGPPLEPPKPTGDGKRH
jgi:hypothetical protein